jgi:hypothetical protein
LLQTFVHQKFELQRLKWVISFFSANFLILIVPLDDDQLIRMIDELEETAGHTFIHQDLMFGVATIPKQLALKKLM